MGNGEHNERILHRRKEQRIREAVETKCSDLHARRAACQERTASWEVDDSGQQRFDLRLELQAETRPGVIMVSDGLHQLRASGRVETDLNHSEAKDSWIRSFTSAQLSVRTSPR